MAIIVGARAICPFLVLHVGLDFFNPSLFSFSLLPLLSLFAASPSHSQFLQKLILMSYLAVTALLYMLILAKLRSILVFGMSLKQKWRQEMRLGSRTGTKVTKEIQP